MLHLHSLPTLYTSEYLVRIVVVVAGGAYPVSRPYVRLHHGAGPAVGPGSCKICPGGCEEAEMHSFCACELLFVAMHTSKCLLM